MWLLPTFLALVYAPRLENQPAAGKESFSVLFELMVNPKVWGKLRIQTLKLAVLFAVEYQSKKKKLEKIHGPPRFPMGKNMTLRL
jgi:hypothetical protein